ncbi:MAG: cyclic nucleotide-binding domain-containing protein [Gallionellaceae bacterium]
MALDNPATEEIFELLIDCEMFKRLEGADLREVAPYFGLNNFSAGDSIFNEGDKGSFMCIVQKGRVSVIKTDMGHNAVVMGTEGAGRAFGEMAVLDGEPRSASCVAETFCEILTLAKRDLDAMIKEKPHIGAEVLRAIAISLSHRMRLSAGRLVDHLESA